MNRKNRSPQKIISNSELMKEWDYEKNDANGIYPEKTSACSNIKVFWICPNCGLNWSCRVGNRTKKEKGQQCPGICNEKRRKEIRRKSFEKSKKKT